MKTFLIICTLQFTKLIKKTLLEKFKLVKFIQYNINVQLNLK